MHIGEEILKKIAYLGFCLEMVQEECRNFAERLFKCQPLARARRDFLASLREILLEGLGVARELRAKLFDLTAEVLGLRVLDLSLLLLLGELFTARIDEREGRSASLEDEACGGRLCLRTDAIRLHLGGSTRAFGDDELLFDPDDLFLLGHRVPEGARLFMRQLFDLAPNLSTQRSAAPLERFELARVARHLPLEPRGTRG